MDQLRIPGPTPCPPEVLQAMTKQMINHRGGQFAQMLGTVTAGLKKIFQSDNDVLVLTASGTGGLEAAVVNMLSPGDHVLSVSIGVFGDRFADIAETYGAKVEKMDFEMGLAADPEMIRKRLAEDKGKEIKAVLVTQNETSTGVTNDMATIGPIVGEHGALLLVDGISSLVAMDCQMDAWKIDLLVAGSQKAFMIPPGLCFVGANDRALAAMKQA